MLYEFLGLKENYNRKGIAMTTVDREMDYAIAERLFKYQLREVKGDLKTIYKNDKYYYYSPDLPEMKAFGQVPDYTTDISAAWEVMKVVASWNDYRRDAFYARLQTLASIGEAKMGEEIISKILYPHVFTVLIAKGNFPRAVCMAVLQVLKAEEQPLDSIMVTCKVREG
jgi:hypothetical protein